MQEFLNFSQLRAYNPVTPILDGEIAYIKGYNIASDGGGGMFIYRNSGVFITSSYYSVDNDGTLIKPTSSTQTGIWVRQLDGHISVAYFGALGFSYNTIPGDYTIKFQRAIENAYQNSLSNPPMMGSTVFVPNGAYVLNSINLRSGISIIGDSNGNTILYSLEAPTSDYLFTMDPGPVFVHMANFNIVSNETTASTRNQGCFYFKARPNTTGYQHGGLWSSTFKNIQVTDFKGIGMFLEGGGNVIPQLPNQFNIFENFRVRRRQSNYEALKMTGQQGQITFLNCQFDGTYSEISGYNKGPNVFIKNNGDIYSAVISFINSTIQDAEYGMIIEYAENVTIDNCWFETLGVAITVRPDTTVPTYICKGINILNSRFANASGFGVLMDVPTANIGLKWAPAIQISNSQVNIHNNYTTPVRDDNKVFPFNFSMFLQVVGNNQGISMSGNSSANANAGRTSGIMQVITIDTITNSIDCKYNKVVFVTNNTTVIKRIFSELNATETIFIRANGGSIKFDGTENIYLSGMNLSGSSGQLILNNGEEAMFTKIDNIITGSGSGTKYFYTLQLTSVVRYSTP